MNSEMTLVPAPAIQELTVDQTPAQASTRRPYTTPALTRLGALRVDTTGTSSVLVLLDANLSYKS